MSFSRLFVRPRKARLGLIALAAIAVSACTDPTSVVQDITADRPVLNFLVPVGDAVLPAGTSALTGIQISNFDLTVPDAFARATAANGGAHRYYAGAACPCYFFETGDIQNSSLAKRAPAPSASGVAFGENTGGGGYVLDPVYWGAPLFDWWMELTGLPADTRVWVGLARLGVSANGSLDQAGVLLGQGVRAPDQLVLAGGTPGGFPNEAANQFNTGGAFGGSPRAPYPADPNANPFVFGSLQTSAAGIATMDAVTSPFDAQGNQVYYTGDFNVTESPIGPNRNGSFATDQYNYLVIWGDNPVTNPNAPVIARIQLAADLDGTSLNVRNNAFAPFPTAVTNTATFKGLPGGANAFAVPGTITLDVSGLPVLASEQYQVFLHNEASGTYQPVAVSTVIDGETTEGVTTFQSPGPDQTVRIVIDASDEVDFALFNNVVVSMEPAAGSATPTDGQILYTQYLSAAQALSSGPLKFGAFPTESVFQIAGSGRASFFGDSLLITFQRVPAAPAGFQYASYIVRMRGPEVEASQRLHTITLDALGNGTDRISVDEVTDFRNFNTYVLVLEPIGTQQFNSLRILVSDNYADKFPEYFETE